MNKFKTLLLTVALVLLVGCGEEEKTYTEAELWDNLPLLEEVLTELLPKKSLSEIEKKNLDLAKNIMGRKLMIGEDGYWKLSSKLMDIMEK